MYCVGTIKQLKCGYFGIQAVSIPPCPGLFLSAAPLEINLVSGNGNCLYPHNHILDVYCYIPAEQFPCNVHLISMKLAHVAIIWRK